MTTLLPKESNKKCSKCNEFKDINLFYKDSSHKDGLTSSCKYCYKQYKKDTKELQTKINKKYYQDNKEKINTNFKDYYQNNKEEHNIRCKNWMDNNKDYFKNYLSIRKNETNKKNRELYKTNPQIKIKNLLRNRLVELLKKTKTNKSKSSLILLGCEIKFIKEYLESKFLPEITWENHGIIWEIDHIIPCSSFDLTKEEEQQKCFYYTNLQPLFKTTKIAESFGYENYIGNRNKKK